MTPEELKTKVEELEALIQSSSDYAFVETQARELLAENALVNEPELHCRTLLALSQSLKQRGLATDALPYAEQALTFAEQIESKVLQAKALGNIGTVYWNLSDYPRVLDYYGKALALNEELGSRSGVAAWLGGIGTVYHNLTDFARALEYYSKALALDEELGNKEGVARHTGNIGNVYRNLSDYSRALEYLGKALVLNEELGNKRGVAANTCNIGGVYYSLLDYAKALEYFTHALAHDEELGDKFGIARHTGNIGNVYYSLSDYAKALEYYNRALATNEELGNKRGIAINTGNIGNVYGDEKYKSYDAGKAEEYMLKAVLMLEEIGTKNAQYEFHKSLAYLYEKQERWKEANEFNKKSYQLEKELKNEEAKKQAEQLDYERKQSEREKHLAVERAKHEATEQLLHNVLPPSIARRMVAGESLIAERIPTVSVLFADIVGFTKLSQRISAEELVEGLDRIFSSFDTLAEKHGLEKIKTIGDAYMVVSGAPEPRADHAEAMAEFALDMLEAMKEFTSKTTGEQIQLRIGIHSGEVVAGVIGKKKFAYDMWGDAVNTASRMESHGEAGKIHVSEEFVLALSLNRPSDTFSHWEKDGMRAIPRGEMEIKGKGKMKTYFLEKYL